MNKRNLRHLLDDPDNGKITYNLGNAFLSWETMIVRLKPMKRLQKHCLKKKINAYYNLGTAHLKNNNMKDALDA